MHIWSSTCLLSFPFFPTNCLATQNLWHLSQCILLHSYAAVSNYDQTIQPTCHGQAHLLASVRPLTLAGGWYRRQASAGEEEGRSEA